ncbi:MAG: hypothetical protein IJD52_05000 [Alphaproteobacteria bacterium]|nr:hypothetical protein [Alphaproteobacteria bacterium]
MDYPDDFNTPTFPAGRRIAVSRVMGICIMVVFFLIVCTCGLLLWTQRSVKVHPFLIDTNEITGAWNIVGHGHLHDSTISATRTLQESVLIDFMQKWFQLSDSATVNELVWQSCDLSECGDENRVGMDADRCSLFCNVGGELFMTFIETVVPNYQARYANGETMSLDFSTLQITPLGEIGTDGGIWQIQAVVHSNLSGPVQFLAYAHVMSDRQNHPNTMGYYIADFNAYKVN